MRKGAMASWADRRFSLPSSQGLALHAPNSSIWLGGALADQPEDGANRPDRLAIGLYANADEIASSGGNTLQRNVRAIAAATMPDPDEDTNRWPQTRQYRGFRVPIAPDYGFTLPMAPWLSRWVLFGHSYQPVQRQRSVQRSQMLPPSDFAPVPSALATDERSWLLSLT
jgi:hypothetical protein